ncbi:MAG: 4-hydroxy-tetrahydrodipicolinate reductase [Bacteroidota bacterium]
MRIILIGYGKMGHEIEKAAIERGHTISGIIDVHNTEDLSSSLAEKADLAIEFTTPSSVLDNLYRCFELNLPVVTGTTGWHDEIDSVKEKCLSGNKSLFYASNFSIGVNLFFVLNEQMARIMNKFANYDVSIEETHHTQKLDSPSGTAVSIAQIIEEQLTRKTGWKLDDAGKDEITVKAIRSGDVKGIHKVRYESDEDFIELTHTAKSRKGFAEGAVVAAEFMKNRKGVFTMRDLLGI